MAKTVKKAKTVTGATNAPAPVRWAYGVDEAAALLSISRGKFYTMMAAKEIHTFRAGKRRLVSADALKAWLSRAQEAA
jgi:excisionase family DNA binding protein